MLVQKLLSSINLCRGKKTYLNWFFHHLHENFCEIDFTEKYQFKSNLPISYKDSYPHTGLQSTKRKPKIKLF